MKVTAMILAWLVAAIVCILLATIAGEAVDALLGRIRTARRGARRAPVAPEAPQSPQDAFAGPEVYHPPIRTRKALMELLDPRLAHAGKDHHVATFGCGCLALVVLSVLGMMWVASIALVFVVEFASGAI